MHLRSDSDERPFVCRVCGKAFTHQSDRKRHEDLHSDKPEADVRESQRTSGGASNTTVTDFASEMENLNMGGNE